MPLNVFHISQLKPPQRILIWQLSLELAENRDFKGHLAFVGWLPWCLSHNHQQCKNEQPIPGFHYKCQEPDLWAMKMCVYLTRLMEKSASLVYSASATVHSICGTALRWQYRRFSVRSTSASAGIRILPPSATFHRPSSIGSFWKQIPWTGEWSTVLVIQM